MARTLVLGAGFGGLAVATELRRRLGDRAEEHEILILDRRPRFMAGLRKLWALVGLGTLEEGQRDRATLDQRGFRFLQRDVVEIDPAARRVVTNEGSFEADFLVVALGAETRPDLVPGLADHGHDLYDADAIPALAKALEAFRGGRIAIVIAGAPYKCPPAPYEFAMLLDEHLRARGIREQTDIVMTTLQPILLPNAGKEGSNWLGGQLSMRAIEHHTGRKVDRVEARRVFYADGTELEADLIIAVPPHKPPAVIAKSGLVEAGGEWIAVEPCCLETSFPQVYAIGDVTQIRLANGLPLPKAGLFAERQGLRVAAAIAAAIAGGPEPEAFDGRGYCFIEMGRSAATLVEGEFFAVPEPKVSIRGVSTQYAQEKRRFETERLERWFGG